MNVDSDVGFIRPASLGVHAKHNTLKGKVLGLILYSGTVVTLNKHTWENANILSNGHKFQYIDTAVLCVNFCSSQESHEFLCFFSPPKVGTFRV